MYVKACFSLFLFLALVAIKPKPPFYSRSFISLCLYLSFPFDRLESLSRNSFTLVSVFALFIRFALICLALSIAADGARLITQ